MTQRNKNLRDMVDGMFRQNSPATPQQIVQEVLSDESRDSGRVGSDSSTSLTPKKPTSPLPAAKFVAPETSLTLPAINVVPITTDEPRPIVEEKQGVWQVIATIVLLIAIAVLLWRFYEPIKSWLAETLKLDPTESLIASSPSSTASLIVPATSTVANTVTVVTSPDQLNAEIINNGDNGAKKKCNV